MSWTQYLQTKGLLEDSATEVKRFVDDTAAGDGKLTDELTDEHLCSRLNVKQVLKPSCAWSLIVDHAQQLADRLTTKVAAQYRLKHEPCKITPFGSYALRAHLRGSDMDLVCIAPEQIHRQDFFQTMPNFLHQSDLFHSVEIIQSLRNSLSLHCQVIHRAPVPIIKFMYDDIPVDMSFARLKATTLTPMVNLLDDAVLDGIEDVENRSLDGPRVHLYIANAIDPNHKDIFCAALRCIKHWAMCRGIYGKPMGLTQLLSEFFDQWSRWRWPNPVILEDPHDEHGRKIEFERLTDFQHEIMPILTPCFPYKSSNPYATWFSLQVIQKEIHRANAIVSTTRINEQPHLVPKLYKAFAFDRKYKHYLNIMMFCDSLKRQEKWKGKLAACMPKMLQLLQQNNIIALAHAWTECSMSVYAYRTQEELSDLMRGVFVEDPIDYYRTSELNPGTLYRLDYYIGLEIMSSAIDRVQGSVLDLTSQVNAFIQDVNSKMSNSDRNTTISVKGVRRRDLKLSCS
ncbi:unnamed protein product [Umbelopsis vinacea]